MTRGSYEAYCLDEAVWYFGSIIESELDKASQAGQKHSRGQSKAESARKRVLNKYFAEESGERQFADPAALYEATRG